MQHITLSEVKTAALKAYQEGRLLVQSSEMESYGYSVLCQDGVTRVCAIGAVLNSEALNAIENENLSCSTLEFEPENLVNYAFDWDSDEYPELVQIQKKHDSWMNGREDKCQDITVARFEADFLALIR